MKSFIRNVSHKSSASKTSPDAGAGEARERLLYAALRLFAEKGYSKTSTREIGQDAGVNIASIKYYFGDKAGLYRAAFTEPMGNAEHRSLSASPDSSLRQSLEMFFAGFLAPLKQSDLIQLCIRLHCREMLEPTGLLEEEISNSINPAHDALLAILMQHMPAKKPDDDLHRLAFSIIGMPLQMFTLREAINALRPELMATPAAIDRWAVQLTDYAEAMIRVAIAQRSAETSSVTDTGKKKKT